MSGSPSLPPLNPEKTASGIVVDPQTQERVIPASRRQDGSVRKEQKVRAGYVPQEDVGAFKSRRQREAEAARGMVPGARANLEGLAAAAEAAEAERAAQTKHKHTNWDSESDDDDEEAAVAAFGKLKIDIKDEAAFPSLGGKPAVKPEAVPAAAAETLTSTLPPKPVSVWNKNQAPLEPAPAPAAVPASPAPSTPRRSERLAERTPDSSSSRWTRGRGIGGPGSRGPSSRQPSSTSEYESYSPRAPANPHPIQGGRKGPIGLAFPPPIDAPSPRGGRAGRGGARGGAAGSPRTPRAESAPLDDAAQPTSPEPRVRREIRVREGGPLAGIRSLLLQNQASDKAVQAERAAKEAEKPAEKPAETADKASEKVASRGERAGSDKPAGRGDRGGKPHDKPANKGDRPQRAARTSVKADTAGDKPDRPKAGTSGDKPDRPKADRPNPHRRGDKPANKPNQPVSKPSGKAGLPDKPADKAVGEPQKPAGKTAGQPQKLSPNAKPFPAPPAVDLQQQK
ncbi:hypothetical protein VHUM_01511 [Vanrija humicola]|uniref:WIBG Mago-binding domain-containing protein n=1 Tax=Vanrija humicola TaxID=5417 RepID=A0A7D8Z2L7_VANHU|nr:hypothetical protein VHUM_01511 [Vanrija humicola]